MGVDFAARQAKGPKVDEGHSPAGCEHQLPCGLWLDPMLPQLQLGVLLEHVPQLQLQLQLLPSWVFH